MISTTKLREALKNEGLVYSGPLSLAQGRFIRFGLHDDNSAPCYYKIFITKNGGHGAVIGCWKRNIKKTVFFKREV